MKILGNFAVFEGGDGSGTTTQLEILRRRFDREIPAPLLHSTFEPTEGPIGQLIRSALRGECPIESRSLALLFAADRNEHLYEKGGLVERCERGELVVSDRYIPSSLVYQGISCGPAFPESLNASFPVPELVIFFDMDPRIAEKRMEKRPVREIYEYLEFQTHVREGYRALFPRWEDRGVRVEIIDASGNTDEVAREVWKALAKMPIMKTAPGSSPAASGNR
jgi:dTMP kinase